MRLLRLCIPCVCAGDEQKKLDVISDEIFCNMLKATGACLRTLAGV